MGWFFALLLLMGRSPRAAGPRTPGTKAGGAPSSFVDAWKTRTLALLPRARSGAGWAARMATRLGSDAAGAAAARWIGIESGGNPRQQSRLGERGLAQAMQVTAPELGLTAADFAAMVDPATTDDKHADLAARVIVSEIRLAKKRAPGADDWGPVSIGVGKLRHGLPLLLRELADQGIIRPTIVGTIDAARQSYKPSTRAAAFAGGKHAVTGRVVDDLMIRFLGSVATVAHGDDAPKLFDGGVA